MMRKNSATKAHVNEMRNLSSWNITHGICLVLTSYKFGIYIVFTWHLNSNSKLATRLLSIRSLQTIIMIHNAN